MDLKKEAYTVSNILKENGIVIIPTDTIYGFSCDPHSKSATERINEIKGRTGKPFLIIDSSEKRVKENYFSDNRIIQDTIEKLIYLKVWPGTVTLIADKKSDLNYPFIKGYDKIAVRFTESDFISEINKKFCSGIISTSCNVTGEKEIFDITELSNVWSDKVDLIVKGRSEKKVSSIIIELIIEKKCLKIIRCSDISAKDDLEKKLEGYIDICL